MKKPSLRERRIKVHARALLGQGVKRDRKNVASSDQKLAFIKQTIGPLERAFKLTGLDSENERHWHLLCFILAQYALGPRRGRPKTWKKTKLSKLRRDIENVRTAHGGKLSDRKCCLILSKDPKYATAPETLRRQLQNTRRTPTAAG